MACALASASSTEAAMTTPLPAASPLALTTSGARWARTQAASKLAAVNVAERAVGMRVAAQELLGERLRALELRAGARRPEAAQPRCGERVDHAGHQRRLRPDDGEVDVLGRCQAHQRGAVLGRDADVAHLGLGGGAGVAGRHQHFGDARGRGALPRQRVLAAAGADDQDLHG